MVAYDGFGVDSALGVPIFDFKYVKLLLEVDGRLGGSLLDVKEGKIFKSDFSEKNRRIHV